ncbi:NAD(+) kinase [Hydrogenophilus thermoluteolus]|uniref:NAD kinase n=1 Tax=Hydrogenophilus thermoluteolus TaxID=297 RepID=A0A2Z6DYK6_HYDTE|nr:inorganic polyphosphate/ATP-NAD kinase [Hydrogenophilus thermoluteolus]HCO77375.1 NAD(+) kinase [Rhodocyclaceae bacterium]
MGVQFQSVGLAAKVHSEAALEALQTLAEWLSQMGCQVVIESSTFAHDAAESCRWTLAPFSRMAQMVDLAVVLGGDGTMLNAARQLVEHDVPLVGINLGRVGFLTDIARSEAIPQLERILHGEYQEERRLLLSGRIVRDGAVIAASHALNDIVMNKGDLGRMIEFELHIDGHFVYTQRSDGMIIATPTGSTAYALSANGPILHPQVAGIALVPLCPHALTARPITIPDRAEIELALLPGHVADVHFDGQGRVEMLPSDRLQVRRAGHQARFLHPIGYDYFAMLREKLHWSASPR